MRWSLMNWDKWWCHHYLLALQVIEWYTLFDGLTCNTCSYFDSCIVFFSALKGQGKIRATRKMFTCNGINGSYINTSLHLAQKYAWIFVWGHCLFLKAHSFSRATAENCELWGTENVQGQISEHIFAPNGDYHVYYPSNLLRNTRSFENWGIFSDIPQF